MLELTLNQMLVMAFLMAAGFALRKLNRLPESASVVLSRLEVYALVPALSLYTQITKCTVENFVNNMHLMIYGLVAVILCMAVAVPLSALFEKNGYTQNVYKYALTFGNYGYMGNFIVLGLFGSDVFYRYSLVVFFVGIACSSWGLYVLIPKENGASLVSSLKRFFTTPPFIAMNTDAMIVKLLLVAFATPIGLNTVVYPAAYSADVSTGASMTVISHLLSVITLPLMFYLFA